MVDDLWAASGVRVAGDYSKRRIYFRPGRNWRAVDLLAVGFRRGIRRERRPADRVECRALVGILADIPVEGLPSSSAAVVVARAVGSSSCHHRAGRHDRGWLEARSARLDFGSQRRRRDRSRADVLRRLGRSRSLANRGAVARRNRLDEKALEAGVSRPPKPRALGVLCLPSTLAERNDLSAGASRRQPPCCR